MIMGAGVVVIFMCVRVRSECTFIDNERVFPWPLGPFSTRAFPPNLQPSRTPSVAQRDTLLNLMATYTVEKPTRMQAWLVARSLCDRGHWRCVLDTVQSMGLLVHWAVEWAAVRLGFGVESVAWLAAKENDAYVNVLRSSRFTLCPAGKNPEQYRIYEALMAGSIPVVERRHWPDGVLHPSYGAHFGCGDQSLRTLDGAPLAWVEDWERDLAAAVSREERAVAAQQDALRKWYGEFVLRLRRLTVWQSHVHFFRRT